MLLVHSTIPFVAFFKINYRCFFSIYSLCDLKHPWEWKSLAAQTTKILSANIGQSLPTTSLCSKGFRVISEQTKTDEWRTAGFSVLAARKMEREILHSLLLAPSFARSLTLFLVLCSQTARKRFLRGITYNGSFFTVLLDNVLLLVMREINAWSIFLQTPR